MGEKRPFHIWPAGKKRPNACAMNRTRCHYLLGEWLSTVSRTLAGPRRARLGRCSAMYRSKEQLRDQNPSSGVLLRSVPKSTLNGIKYRINVVSLCNVLQRKRKPFSLKKDKTAPPPALHGQAARRSLASVPEMSSKLAVETAANHARQAQCTRSQQHQRRRFRCRGRVRRPYQRADVARLTAWPDDVRREVDRLARVG